MATEVIQHHTYNIRHDMQSSPSSTGAFQRLQERKQGRGHERLHCHKCGKVVSVESKYWSCLECICVFSLCLECYLDDQEHVEQHIFAFIRPSNSSLGSQFSTFKRRLNIVYPGLHDFQPSKRFHSTESEKPANNDSQTDSGYVQPMNTTTKQSPVVQSKSGIRQSKASQPCQPSKPRMNIYSELADDDIYGGFYKNAQQEPEDLYTGPTDDVVDHVNAGDINEAAENLANLAEPDEEHDQKHLRRYQKEGGFIRPKYSPASYNTNDKSDDDKSHGNSDDKDSVNVVVDRLPQVPPPGCKPITDFFSRFSLQPSSNNNAASKQDSAKKTRLQLPTIVKLLPPRVHIMKPGEPGKPTEVAHPMNEVQMHHVNQAMDTSKCDQLQNRDNSGSTALVPYCPRDTEMDRSESKEDKAGLKTFLEDNSSHSPVLSLDSFFTTRFVKGEFQILQCAAETINFQIYAQLQTTIMFSTVIPDFMPDAYRDSSSGRWQHTLLGMKPDLEYHEQLLKQQMQTIAWCGKSSISDKSGNDNSGMIVLRNTCPEQTPRTTWLVHQETLLYFLRYIIRYVFRDILLLKQCTSGSSMVEVIAFNTEFKINSESDLVDQINSNPLFLKIVKAFTDYWLPQLKGFRKMWITLDTEWFNKDVWVNTCFKPEPRCFIMLFLRIAEFPKSDPRYDCVEFNRQHHWIYLLYKSQERQEFVNLLRSNSIGISPDCDRGGENLYVFHWAGCMESGTFN